MTESVTSELRTTLNSDQKFKPVHSANLERSPPVWHWPSSVGSQAPQRLSWLVLLVLTRIRTIELAHDVAFLLKDPHHKLGYPKTGTTMEN